MDRINFKKQQYGGHLLKSQYKCGGKIRTKKFELGGGMFDNIPIFNQPIPYKNLGNNEVSNTVTYTPDPARAEELLSNNTPKGLPDHISDSLIGGGIYDDEKPLSPLSGNASVSSQPSQTSAVRADPSSMQPMSSIGLSQLDVPESSNELMPMGGGEEEGGGSGINFSGIMGGLSTAANAAMKYAPVVSAGLDYFNGDFKPETTSYDRVNVGEKLKADRISENRYVSDIDSQTRAAVSDVANVSGGNAAAVRANVGAAHTGAMKAKESALTSIRDRNVQNQQQVDQYNFGRQDQVNQINNQISMREKDANSQNRAAAKAAKERAKANFFGQIGSMGKESSLKKMISGATGYDQNMLSGALKFIGG